MSELRNYLWLIPGLPLAAAVLIAFLGPRLLGKQSHWLAIAASVGSCFLAVLVFVAVYDAAGHVPEHSTSLPVALETYYTWFSVPSVDGSSGVDVTVKLRVDALTAMMLVMVTFIGSLIVIYSAGYMHGDPGYPRFFAEMSLFIFSMTGLVLADNFLLLYAFWEGVGLCSYLLVGFWFQKPSAAAAARKAFLVTRLGDVGFFLGIVLLWASCDYEITYDGVFAKAGSLNHGVLATACLLLFCGAVGKSAQFPLHVWLPDAMEGPTPVSALIHAATMVTAGVYLVARCTPLFALVPEVQAVVATIGAVTALLAALIALTQTDLKRVLAYSTVSQLGYMFLAVGSGAVVAGMFHLFTHAFFKALLFLAAGSVMHAMGGVIDMRRFSGLRKLLPYTHATFLCGAMALAAVPFVTSGFWSKDEIFAGVLHAAQTRPDYAVLYAVLLGVAFAAAALTAFYTFRAYFLTFWGPETIPEEAGHHAHESPPVMWLPLVVLAVGALGVGYLNAAPFTHYFGEFLNATPHLVPPDHPPGQHAEAANWALVVGMWLGSAAVVALGIGVACWMYVARPGSTDKFAHAYPRLYQLSLNKFYLDELYYLLIVRPLEALAQAIRFFDLRVIDGLVDLIGQIPRGIGFLFRPVQNGLVQFYALAMALGIAVFLFALMRPIW